jgi:hypothetical protein
MYAHIYYLVFIFLFPHHITLSDQFYLTSIRAVKGGGG